jgi:hypothetical protein
MTKIIGNGVISLAGAVLMVALLLVAAGILFGGAFLIVMLRSFNPRPALPAETR